MGTLVFAGEGGASAASSIDTTAAGDIWDNFDGVKGHSGGTAGVAVMIQLQETMRFSILYHQWLMV